MKGPKVIIARASTWTTARATRVILVLAGLVACAGSQQPSPAADPAAHAQPAAATDTRSPIERRRDAACEGLGPRLTACAVEDTRADLAAGQISPQQLERDTASGVQQKNTETFVAACKTTAYSSRQVRVLEVCLREETRCAPLLDCLGHLSDAAPTTTK